MQFAARRTRFLNPVPWVISIAIRPSIKGNVLYSSHGKLSCHGRIVGRAQELISVLHNLHHHECPWNYLLQLQMIILESKPRRGGRRVVNRVVSLIFPLSIAAQGVAHTKPHPTCPTGNSSVDLQDSHQISDCCSDTLHSTALWASLALWNNLDNNRGISTQKQNCIQPHGNQYQNYSVFGNEGSLWVYWSHWRAETDIQDRSDLMNVSLDALVRIYSGHWPWRTVVR